MLPDDGMLPTDRQDTGRAGQECPEQTPPALDWWPVLRSVPPPMTAELARLRAAFPAFSVSIRAGWRGPTFEAWRDPAAGGLYAVITQDAGELWRELGECEQETSTDVASATGDVTARSPGQTFRRTP